MFGCRNRVCLQADVWLDSQTCTLEGLDQARQNMAHIIENDEDEWALAALLGMTCGCVCSIATCCFLARSWRITHVG